LLTTESIPDYLFNNAREKGQQKYDEILDDLKDLMEEGYSVYVTGHRYVTMDLFCFGDS